MDGTTGTAGPLRLGAVVLTGGTARRLHGLDKAGIEIDGVTLLERALHATLAAAEVVVVGDEVPTTWPVTWAREEPPGGGPAAGLLAGTDRFAGPPDLVCVLAVDMPKVNAGTIARLTWAVEADPGADGAVLVDETGHRQPLAAVYRLTSLRAARPADRAAEHGLPVRRLVGDLRLVEVPTVGDEARDVDTPEDLADLADPLADRSGQ
jgi:molybdopterin-guanine dinucleotide biosynthesis protein A